MAARDAEYIITLDESLRGEWIKLPFACMRECGSAVQTYGGLLRVTTAQTFVAVAQIARNARLPVATVRKHLRTLSAAGWIKNCGRGKASRGHLRRTTTLRVERLQECDTYGVLPWWATRTLRPWSSRAVLSVVMMQLCKLRSALSQLEHGPEDLQTFVEDCGADGRFEFSIKDLHELTGLSPHSIIQAKQTLNRMGVIRWRATDGADLLTPNFGFRVRVTPTEGSRVLLDYETLARD